jgi:hypothetical protein
VLALKTEGDRARKKFGVKSTPTPFVNGQMQCGDMSIEELMRAIDPLIRAESRKTGKRSFGPREFASASCFFDEPLRAVAQRRPWIPLHSSGPKQSPNQL